MDINRSTWIWELARKIPAIPDRCAPVIAEVLEALQKHGWSAEDQFAIRMALEEAIMNAIRHGNQCDPAKLVTLELGISPSEFYAAITDRGFGFDPDKVPDPTADENLERDCGRGVMLMKQFVDSVEFNDRGNEVMLKKVKIVS